MSRDDLGAQAGLSYKQIRAIERGDVRKPREYTATSIAAALRKDVLDIFPDRVRL